MELLRNRAIQLVGLTAVIVGLTVLVAWVLGNDPSVSRHPESWEMGVLEAVMGTLLSLVLIPWSVRAVATDRWLPYDRLPCRLREERLCGLAIAWADRLQGRATIVSSLAGRATDLDGFLDALELRTRLERLGTPAALTAAHNLREAVWNFADQTGLNDE